MVKGKVRLYYANGVLYRKCRAVETVLLFIVVVFVNLFCIMVVAWGVGHFWWPFLFRNGVFYRAVKRL
jgi:hypothetical protein